MTLFRLNFIHQLSSQNIGNGDRNVGDNANETEIAAIFARANESTSFSSYVDPLSMPSMSSRAEETRIMSHKMRILLLKGLSGLYKTFPEENKNHQVTLMIYILRHSLSFLKSR